MMVIRTGLAAALLLTAGVLAAPNARAQAGAPAGGAGTNQAQQTTGSGQNQAGSVTQPGVAQSNNSGKEQTGNTGTGMAGGRSDKNPTTLPK